MKQHGTGFESALHKVGPDGRVYRLPCPHCKGTGRTWFIACGSDGYAQGDEQCSTCNGSRSVTAEQLERIARGHQMQRARVLRRESLREAAARLGISPVELSRQERGDA